MNKQEKRKITLLNQLHVHKKMDVKTVADQLAISEATARRLFAALEEEKKVIRIHGGVQIAPEIGHDYSYQISAKHRIKEKTQIAGAAVSLIENGDAVFMDSGSTVFRLAETLSIKIQTGVVGNIIILTNSLDLVNVLAAQCKVIIIGGEARLQRRDVCGSIAEKTLSLFKVNKAFFGSDGIDIESGFMTTDERTANMNGIVLKRAKHAYVLADSSKFNRSSFITYAGFDEIDKIITDSEITEEELQAYTSAGAEIKVIEAK